MKKNKIKIFLLILSLFTFQFVTSQNNLTVDSNTIKKQFEELIPLLKNDIFAAKKLSFKIIANAQSINHKYLEARGLNSLGIIYFNLSDYDSSKFYYGQALNMAEKYKLEDIKRKSIGNLGLLYSRTGDYEKSLDMLFKSLKMCEDVKDTLQMAGKLADIASTFAYWNKPRKSIDYNKLALQYFKITNNIQGQANVLNSIGSAYCDLKILDTAKIYFDQSYTLKIKIGDKRGASNTLLNLALLSVDLHNDNDALRDYFRSLEIKKQISDKEGIANIYNNVGSLYLKQKKYQLAKDYLTKSFILSKEVDSKYLLKTAAMNLSELYDTLRNYKEALKYNRIFFETKIKLSDDNITAKITEIETKYKTEKKEIENAKLLKENEVKKLQILHTEQAKKFQLLLFTGLFIILLFIAGFLFYRYRQKQRNELMQEQSRQEKIRYKAIIDSEEKERIRIAKELHDGLGQLLSSAKLNISSLEGCVPEHDEYLLQNSSGIIDEAVKEVRSISHNLMPTALMNYGLIEAIEEQIRRINDAKQITIFLDKKEFSANPEKETEIALYRIFQEILNNMMKHSKASVINISISSSNNKIFLLIKDNGTGFDTSAIKDSKGIGWQNIYSRVSMLNGEISINSEIGKGTEISMIF